MRISRLPSLRVPGANGYCLELAAGNLIVKPWADRLFSERQNNLGWRVGQYSIRWQPRSKA